MCNCPNEHPKSEGLTKSESSRSFNHNLNAVKAILLEGSTFSGDNAYDHLCDIIKRIIDERPPNVVDYFEEFSRSIREQKYFQHDPLPDYYLEPHGLERAKKILSVFGVSITPPTENFHFNEEEANLLEEGSTVTKKLVSIKRDVLFLNYYWSLCGFGLPQEEVFLLSCSMNKFHLHPIVNSCRFWGKIFGLSKNYYIVEVVLTEDELYERKKQIVLEMKAGIKETSENLLEVSENIGEQNLESHPEPGSIKKEQLEFLTDSDLEIPAEIIGTGLNRTSYFVCNDLTGDWIELPVATPRQICVSREIRKYLKGDLEAEIDSYPVFPGKEKHYLRSLIARITSGTYIAPLRYFKVKFSNSDEVKSENETNDDQIQKEDTEINKNFNVDFILIENQNYKPLVKNELKQTSFWVHVRPEILDQGRVRYFDKKQLNLDELQEKTDGESEESEEDSEEEEEIEEEGKSEDENNYEYKFLTPIINDKFIFDIPAWIVRTSTELETPNTAVIFKSNVWPGAFSFTLNEFADSIYIGWGHKHSRSFSPKIPPPVEEKHKIGSEISELSEDLSVVDEGKWEVPHRMAEEIDMSSSAEGETNTDDSYI